MEGSNIRRKYFNQHFKDLAIPDDKLDIIFDAVKTFDEIVKVEVDKGRLRVVLRRINGAGRSGIVTKDKFELREFPFSVGGRWLQ